MLGERFPKQSLSPRLQLGGRGPDALSVWAVVHTCPHQGDLQDPSSWASHLSPAPTEAKTGPQDKGAPGKGEAALSTLPVSVPSGSFVSDTLQPHSGWASLTLSPECISPACAFLPQMACHMGTWGPSVSGCSQDLRSPRQQPSPNPCEEGEASLLLINGQEG